jgi:polysaccharide deacetylase 2 family uncharacterized protein YibQ
MTPKRRTKTHVPLRIKLVIVSFTVLLVAGVGIVKLFQSARGPMIFLDAGFRDNYAVVQLALDEELRRALVSFGFHRDLKEHIRPTRVSGRDYPVRHWEASCKAPCDPVKIALAVTQAAKERGGVTRSRVSSRAGSGAGGDPETLFITVGSRRYPTHEMTVHLATTRPYEPVAEQPAAKPRLAVVIDDFGHSKSATVERFLALDFPFTVAVMPELPQSGYVLQRARSLGKEVILHLPMEGGVEGARRTAITTAMSGDSIRHVLEGYLREYPGVAGVNNHQGSVATRDRRVMLAVIAAIKKYGLFFLDSLTASESIAYNTAKSLDVPTAKNDVFLDDGTEDARVVEKRLLDLAALARQRGSAIGIGHPKPWTYEALARNQKTLKESGIELVFVSRLME